MALRDWYEEHLLSRCIKFACGDPKIMALRAEVVPLAWGKVFELGVGGGLNQPFYDTARVTAFAGIDPGGKLLDYARAAARAKGWEADLRPGRGEAIPFPDASFDTVVSTYTLCSVDDQAQVLSELRRILKPGGRLLFLEHGRAPDPGPARWQRRIEPVWKRVMGNCHLTREIGAALRRAGFDVEPIGRRYLPKMPRWAGWMEWGSARRSGL
jgi:SAM-dependent methyltransferase